MKCILDLNLLFEKIKKIDYACIKTDAPYTPLNFPTDYPIGKDLDIIVHENSIGDLIDIMNDYSQKYKEHFTCICIEENHGFRVRYQKKKKLHFQIDFKFRSDELDIPFMRKLLQTKVKVDNYFIANKEHEIIIRLLSYYKTKTKTYHLDYVRDTLEEL